jgi:hypothetical protein
MGMLQMTLPERPVTIDLGGTDSPYGTVLAVSKALVLAIGARRMTGVSFFWHEKKGARQWIWQNGGPVELALPEF